MSAADVLDVGCGTGVVTEEIAARTKGRVVGLDRDPEALAIAARSGSPVEYRQGDAERLPFATASFDLVVCHFLLLWLSEPLMALREMARVCRPGGAVFVSAEPDYGGRIDYPSDLPVRDLQIRSLQRDGADPFVGRKLRALFTGAGLEAEIGLVPGVWTLAQYAERFDAEWDLLERTCEGLVPPDEIAAARAKDHAAVVAGTRFLFLPVFYGLARKGMAT